MNQKKAKAARRASGISKDARRDEREFEQLVMARRLEMAKEWDEKPNTLPARRRALAWVGLAIVGVFVAGLFLGAC